jgi:hypothetical protein
VPLTTAQKAQKPRPPSAVAVSEMSEKAKPEGIKGANDAKTDYGRQQHRNNTFFSS